MNANHSSLTESGTDQDRARAISDDEALRIAQAYGRRKNAIVDHRYSYFDRANVLLVHELEQNLLQLLLRCRVAQLADKRICDVGCGSGHWLREFVKWGAAPENVVGIDLLSDRIAVAVRLCSAGMRIECGDAARLPWSNESFDIVTQFVVFTSILNPFTKQQIAREMVRVLKPGGIIVWYDFHVNNPSNHDVRGVKKREIQSLFPACDVNLKRITLAPPISRRLAHYSPLLCTLLGKLPFLCTHYLGVIRKRSTGA